jgi:hypothetical protein
MLLSFTSSFKSPKNLPEITHQPTMGGGRRAVTPPHHAFGIQPGAVPCLHSLNATYAVSFTFDSKTKISLRGYTERRKRFFLGLNDIP